MQSDLNDVTNRQDIQSIVARFYETMLQDAIVGFIFTDIAQIDLEEHLPVIVDFWFDVLFTQGKEQKQYKGNVLKKHLELNQLMSLKPGHFTRWLYLFNQAVNQQYAGDNAELMKHRAELVAKTISAAITDQKRGDMNLILPE